MRQLTVAPGSGIYPAGVDEYGRTFGIGSYGLQVTDDSGHRLLLTAAHVVGSLSSAHGNNPNEVLLISGVGAPGSGDPVIGQVLRSSPPEPTRDVLLDASLVSVEDHLTLSNEIIATTTSRLHRELYDLEDLIPVVKRGSSSGLTRGLLDPTPVTARVELPGAKGDWPYFNYEEGWWVESSDKDQPFAKPGDSGSIVIDEDECVVGMVVAVVTANPSAMKATDPAFVVPISGLLDGLEISLIGPNRPCTLS